MMRHLSTYGVSAGMRGEVSGANDRGDRAGLGCAQPHDEAARAGNPAARIVARLNQLSVANPFPCRGVHWGEAPSSDSERAKRGGAVATGPDITEVMHVCCLRQSGRAIEGRAHCSLALASGPASRRFPRNYERTTGTDYAGITVCITTYMHHCYAALALPLSRA